MINVPDVLKQLIQKKVAVPLKLDWNEELNIFTDLHLKNIDLVECCISLEYKLGIDIPDKALCKIQTIKDFQDCVFKALKEKIKTVSQDT